MGAADPFCRFNSNRCSRGRYRPGYAASSTHPAGDGFEIVHWESVGHVVAVSDVKRLQPSKRQQKALRGRNACECCFVGMSHNLLDRCIGNQRYIRFLMMGDLSQRTKEPEADLHTGRCSEQRHVQQSCTRLAIAHSHQKKAGRKRYVNEQTCNEQ